MTKNGLEVETASPNSNQNATEFTPLVPKNGTGSRGDPEPEDRGVGITMKQAVFLIAGEMTGGGVLALPRALTKTGWIGVPIIIMMCVMAAFSGKRLSDCWTIVEARNSDLSTRKRNPYAIIAEQTLGKKWSVAVSMALVVSQFGTAVVFLLLAAQIVEQVFMVLVPTLTICTWYLIVTCAMTPLLFYGSPKDFPFLGVVASFSVVVACILYFIELMNEYRPFVFRVGIHGFSDFFLAVGMIMFAFGGASSFPTIQNDMINRSQFTKSLNYSFLATLALYLPMAVGGYAVKGEIVAPNVATSLSATSLTLAGNIFMIMHLVSAFVIAINPVCQEIEEMYKSSRDSLGHRTLIRLSIMLAILFVGESIPRFYTILALVGGTTVALLTFVLPNYCYLCLINAAPEEHELSNMCPPGWTRMMCWQMTVMGVGAGALTTYSALAAMFGTAQAIPCYLR